MASVRRCVCEDDGVRFHVRADAPGKPQRVPFLGARLTLRGDLQPLRREPPPSTAPALRRPDRAPAPASPRGWSGARVPPDLSAVEIGHDDAHVGLLASTARAVSVDTRGNHRLDEGGHDGLRGRGVDRAVERHDAAKGGQAVGVARPDVRVGRRLAGRHAARVRVLDDRRRRLLELQDDASGRVEIEQIRVRKLLALQNLGGAETRPATCPERRRGKPDARQRPTAAGGTRRARWCGFSP